MLKLLYKTTHEKLHKPINVQLKCIVLLELCSQAVIVALRGCSECCSNCACCFRGPLLGATIDGGSGNFLCAFCILLEVVKSDILWHPISNSSVTVGRSWKAVSVRQLAGYRSVRCLRFGTALGPTLASMPPYYQLTRIFYCTSYKVTVWIDAIKNLKYSNWKNKTGISNM